MFSLKTICSIIPVDKASINKNNNKSSINSKSMIYSSYVNKKSKNYRTVTEGQVTSINMINVTPHTATIVFTYVSNPVYFEMTLVNIQDTTDTHVFEIYESPYTFIGLRPNSYYTITTYSTFISTNKYSNVFPSAILTLFEGPPTDLSVNTILNESATLFFTPSIGNPTYFIINIIDTNDPTNILFYQTTTSPVFMTGLQPDITYDVQLSVYYSDTNNTYTVYERKFFQTYDENYPVLDSITNITNMGSTINFEYTGMPYYNAFELTNVKDTTDVYIIKDTELSNNIIIDGLRIDTSYNLTITSVYITGHTYSIHQPNAFHTWNESKIASADILSIVGNKITITFTSAVGNVIGYNVSLTDIDGNVTTYSYINTPPGQVQFSNLKVYTNYIFTVTSVYTVNTYTYQYPTYIQTLNEGPVTDISCSNVLNTSAYISFPASPGINLSYNIMYKGQRNNTKNFIINGITSTDISLNKLSIYTPYSVTITTYYTLTNNYYSFSKTNLFTTVNEGATTIYNVVISNRSIAITFINTYGYPSAYTFHADSSSNISDTYNGIANTQYTYTLSGLSSDMSYNVYVVTKYESNRTYVTTWPNIIYIRDTGRDIELSRDPDSNLVTINTTVTPTIYNSNYYIYTFTDPSNSYDISFTNVSGNIPLNILVVGGGGGGGSGLSSRGGYGGGGGGCVGIGFYEISNNCILTVNVGGGGLSNYATVPIGTGPGETPYSSITVSQLSNSFTGGNTIIKQNGNIIINAYGGGSGTGFWTLKALPALSGGSGGGGARFGGRFPGNATNGFGYLNFYGNKGGGAYNTTIGNYGAGGGGAFLPAPDVSNIIFLGYGGNGYTINTTLYPGIPLKTYGGGGAGGKDSVDISGGTGGGGNYKGSNQFGENGIDGLGGGGAGGGNSNIIFPTRSEVYGGRGGNGVVIISIPIINVR